MMRSPSFSFVAKVSAGLATVVGLAVGLSVPEVGAHAGNSDPAVIHACYNPSGVIKHVDVNGSCQGAETPLHWAINGPQGPIGPPGPLGPSGALGLAGQTCPSGQFVTGFDLSGRINCAAPSATGPGNTPSEVSLPIVAQLIGNALGSATGEMRSTPVSFETPLGNVVFQTIGFALCLPPNLTAPPSAIPPLYGCTPNMQVTVVTQANNSVKITVNLSHIYVDLAGVFQNASTTRPLEGFVLLEGVSLTLTAALLDAGGGMKTLGPASSASITTNISQVLVHSDTTGLEPLIVDLNTRFFTASVAAISDEIPRLVNPILTSVPPFTL